MAKKTKTTSTSKRKRGRPRNPRCAEPIPITGHTKKKKYFDEYEVIRTPPKPEEPDFEWENEDHKEMKYPPPKKGAKFCEKWIAHIGSITERDNFKLAYLSQLEILCDLFVEYEEISKFLRENGRSYHVNGRDGSLHKLYPEVNLQKQIQKEIAQYSRMLGLVLTKDKTKESGGEEEEWA